MTLALSLSKSFGRKNLMALITWSIIVGGIFIRNVNVFVWPHISYNVKILFGQIAQTLTGLLLSVAAPYIGDNGVGFAILLLGGLLVGMGSSLGEQTALSYCSTPGFGVHEDSPIGAWSSGTGGSGVIAAIVILGLQQTNMNDSQIIALQIPFVLLYFGAYFFGVVQVRKEEVSIRKEEGSSESVVIFEHIPNFRRSWSSINLSAGSSSNSTPSSGSTKTGSSNSSSSIKSMQEFNNNNQKKEDQQPLLQQDENVEDDDFNDGYIIEEQEEEEQQKEKDAVLGGGGGGGAVAAVSAVAEQENKNKNVDVVKITRKELDEYDNEEEWSCLRKNFFFSFSPSFPYQAIKLTFSLIMWCGTQLFLVYVLEYCIQIVVADIFPDMSTLFPAKKTNSTNDNNMTTTTTTIITTFVHNTTNTSSSGCKKATSPSDFGFITRNAFVISQFCYQVSVLLSRSSLSFGIVINRVDLLTWAQLVNAIGFILLAKTKWLLSNCPSLQDQYTWVFECWMLWVGLLGGASYVMVFNRILHDDDIQVGLKKLASLEVAKQKERRKRMIRDGTAGDLNLTPKHINARELAMSCGALYQSAGISMGSAVALLLDNTLLK